MRTSRSITGAKCTRPLARWGRRLNLIACIFYLAQLTIVGDNYTGPALFVDDLLTGEAPRQFLGGVQCRGTEHQNSERQDHSVHDFATPRAQRRPCLEHTARHTNAMVMMICRPLVNLTEMPQIKLKAVRDAVLPPHWTAPAGDPPLRTRSRGTNYFCTLCERVILA